MEFQQQMQDLQPSIQTYQNVVSNNYQNLRYEDHKVARLPICWRCGEVGHMKKDCTKVLYCTNCGKNNHITRRNTSSTTLAYQTFQQFPETRTMKSTRTRGNLHGQQTTN